jgi:L-ascorbate metabolism protein UlaG (beta-lactamase superfamily)
VAGKAPAGVGSIVAVLGAARHLAGLGRSAVTKRRQERDDAAALRVFEASALELPPGLEIEWLGVSGYRLTFEGQTLYIDPYVSRVPLSSLLLRRSATPDPTAIERFLPPAGRAMGVLVGHTHFDHAVDAPAVARRFGCRAYGSRSLATLMRLHGLGELAVEVDPYRTYELGPFEVSFTPSAHSKLLLGLAVPFAGELTCDHLHALTPSAYRCGQVWGIEVSVGGVTFYHQGSADLLDDAIRMRKVDVFLAGVAGRNFTKDYWKRILPRLDPRTVVPTHYDDFFRPLQDRMDLIGNVRLAELPAELRAVSGDVAVAALPRLQAPRVGEDGERGQMA